MHGSRIYSPVLNLLIPCTNSVPFWFDIIFKPTYHPLILREEGLLLEITALNLLSLLLLFNYYLQRPIFLYQLQLSIIFALRFFADTDQGSMILDGRKIWTRRLTTEKKQMWTFPRGKKTQMYIQKTKRL